MTKVGQVLKFQPGGLSVEEARKAMFAAKEAPSGLSAAKSVVAAAAPAALPVVAEEFEIETPPAAAAAVSAVVPAVVTPPAATPVVPPKIERVETSNFVGEIKQENGKWVAEIRYKTGAGTEKFTADTKNGLLLKLLEGKGHATLRVNKAVRREKLGWAELDRQYPLPEGITAKDFEEMPDKAQDALLWSIATQQIVQFNEAHPEFYKDPDGKNAKKINDFLTHNNLPITLRNLQYAYDELTDSNLPANVRIEEKPGSERTEESDASLVLPASPTVPARTDSVPAAEPPAAVPTAPVVAAPAVVVRKRGTTGLQPGQSSTPTELERPGDGGEPRELSEAELRKLPLADLKRIAIADRVKRSGAQR